MDNQNNVNNDDSNSKNTDLDSLLDDALEDFSKPTPPKKHEETADPLHENSNVWTDEFVSTVTQNFEATMKSVLNQQKTTSESESNEESTANSLELGAMSAEFAKFAEAAAKAATNSSADKDFTFCLAETMQQMAKNKEEAQGIPSAEELGKIFESFGFGESENADGNDMGGLFPIMQTMLENILSKDVLYPPLKEIVQKYPDWLADNRINLSEEDYERYNKQYDIMKQVVEKFESENQADSEEVKAQTSENILLLMQKLQELGQPPKDLVGDFEPLMSMDESGNPQLPDLSSLVSGLGFPTFGAMGGSDDPTSSSTASQENAGTAEGAEQCSLM